jgi:hypothetical protein
MCGREVLKYILAITNILFKPREHHAHRHGTLRLNKAATHERFIEVNMNSQWVQFSLSLQRCVLCVVINAAIEFMVRRMVPLLSLQRCVLRVVINAVIEFMVRRMVPLLSLQRCVLRVVINAAIEFMVRRMVPLLILQRCVLRVVINAVIEFMVRRMTPLLSLQRYDMMRGSTGKKADTREAYAIGSHE